jgi:hypothetical protein
MSRLKTIWRLLNLPCRDMTHLASASLECNLSRLERIALKLHVLYCIGCRRYLRQIVFVRRAVRQVVEHIATGATLPGPGLPDEVRARIKEALREY